MHLQKNFSRLGNVDQRVARLFNNPAYSDVTVFGPECRKYFCSKLLLATSSAYFEEELSRAEMPCEIFIRDIHPGWALLKVLLFIHGIQIEVDDHNITPIWGLALRLQVHSLSDACEEYSAQYLHITSENCIDILKQAVAAGVHRLVDRSQEFICNNMMTIRRLRAFQYLSFECIKAFAINGYSNAEIPYLDVVVSLVVWLSDTGAERKTIEELFELVDFRLLSSTDVLALGSRKEVTSCVYMHYLVTRGQESLRIPQEESIMTAMSQGSDDHGMV